MKRVHHALLAVVATAISWAAFVEGCASDLDTGTAGHDLCDAAGQCAAGYVCNQVTQTCVVPGSGSTGGQTTTSSASTTSSTGGMGGAGGMGGTGGTGGTGGDAGGPDGDAGCSTGQTFCGSACTTTATDPQNCGDCGKICPPVAGGTVSCSGGVCGFTCAGGLTPCNGACVNEQTDPQNCGTCGKVCTTALPGATPTCSAGGCVAACETAGLPDLCPSGCVNEQADPSHCGSCTKACDPPVSGGATGAPKCATGTCDATCNTTTPLDCPVTGGHACVDPKTDPQFCNDCNTHCAGGKSCVNGACVAACPPGLVSCNGVCVNEQSDPNHCGSCSKGCLVAVAGACSGGSCSTLCGGGLSGCGVGALTACVDLMKDPTHCGTCATVCGVDQVCTQGACKSYIFASGPWECGNGNAFPVPCAAAGICLPAGATCP